jgi:DnaJ-class molecular chaperone
VPVLTPKGWTTHGELKVDDGQSLKLSGEGEAGRNGAPAGALFVRMRVQPDERFVRDGDDIRTMLDISVIDATLGTTVDVETVQGTSSMTIPAGTQPGQTLRLKGKGMPVLNTSRHGDQYVTVNVVVPEKLSREEKHLYEQLKKFQK